MTEQEEYLNQGITLLINILKSRLEVLPLTEEERVTIGTYNDMCMFHPVSTDPYCKYCKGIKIGLHSEIND